MNIRKSFPFNSRHHAKTRIEQEHGNDILTQMVLKRKIKLVVLAWGNIAVFEMTKDHQKNKDSFNTLGLAVRKIILPIEFVLRLDLNSSKNHQK